MRQGQQNRRGRGRNNNHSSNNGQRKGQNPLARSYESSGPDVKLRGTPAHIAEKYMALARDAQSSGDPVLAENYLQHAEHYNRIIMAYRDQQIAQGGSDPGIPRSRPQFGTEGDQGGEYGDDEGDDQNIGQGFGAPSPVGMGEQPPAAMPQRSEGGGQRFEGRPQRDNRHHDNPRGEHNRFPPRDRHQGEPRGGFQERGERPDRGERPERPERPERHHERGADRMERGGDRPERSERPERPQPQGEGFQGEGPPQRRRERFQPSTVQHEQPEFLRRPVRRPRRDEAADVPPLPAPAAADDQE